MLPQLNQIIDSQCGFKAFPGEVAARIAMDTVEKKFAFDIELLLRWRNGACRVDHQGRRGVDRQ